MSSPSWISLPPPSPSHPSRLSQSLLVSLLKKKNPIYNPYPTRFIKTFLPLQTTLRHKSIYWHCSSRPMCWFQSTTVVLPGRPSCPCLAGRMVLFTYTQLPWPPFYCRRVRDPSDVSYVSLPSSYPQLSAICPSIRYSTQVYVFILSSPFLLLTYLISLVRYELVGSRGFLVLYIMFLSMGAKSLQSCPTLCNSMDCCSPRGSSVHEILQARTLEWVAVPSSRASSWPRDRTHVSYIACIGRQVLYH